MIFGWFLDYVWCCWWFWMIFGCFSRTSGPWRFVPTAPLTSPGRQGSPITRLATAARDSTQAPGWRWLGLKLSKFNCRPKDISAVYVSVTHRIHGAAIYGNIYHQYTPNVSIYSSTMDPMGNLSTTLKGCNRWMKVKVIQHGTYGTTWWFIVHLRIGALREIPFQSSLSCRIFLVDLNHLKSLFFHHPWRIHGAAIYANIDWGYIDGIHGTPHIAAPWIRHRSWFIYNFVHHFPSLKAPLSGVKSHPAQPMGFFEGFSPELH